MYLSKMAQSILKIHIIDREVKEEILIDKVRHRQSCKIIIFF